jgi:amino acid adenylation domain-containing protein
MSRLIPSEIEKRAASSDTKKSLFENRLKEGRESTGRRIAIPRRQAPEQAVLSFPQQSYWLLDQLEPGCPAYNLPAAWRLSGPLDVAALQQSLTAVADRHEVLRTRFAAGADGPRQFILPPAAIALPVVDLSDAPDALAELLAKEAMAPFDLAAGSAPAMRQTLVRLGPDEHVLVMTTHHIICDGWSYSIFFRDLATFYEAFSAGRPTPLAPLDIQYADFAEWQRGEPDASRTERDLKYWLHQLDGELRVLDLPTDRPRPSFQTVNGARYEFTLGKDLTAALKDIALAERATGFMVLLAAFDVLMMRYADQKDVIVCTPIANRTRPEIEGLIGCFANATVMRTDLSSDPTFQTLLDRVRCTTLDALEHQDLPFEKLVETLKPVRGPSRTPPFQVMFQLNNTPKPVERMADLRVEEMQLSDVAVKIDLRVDMVEKNGGFLGRVDYNKDLFDETTIRRMMAAYDTLLGSVAADQTKPISAYPLLTAADEAMVLRQWNDTAHPLTDGIGVHDLIARQSQRVGDKPALYFEDAVLSYSELERWSNRMAHGLVAAGVEKGATVGLCVDNGFELLAGFLGILKAGAVFVPLDPTHPPARLGYMIDDAGIKVVLTQVDLLPVLAEVEGDATIIALDTEDGQFADLPETAPDVPAFGDDPAYVIYTSGSTGRPKGVLVSHGSILNHMQWAIDSFHITENDPHLLVANYCFDAALWDLLAPLMTGALLVMPRRDDAQDPDILIGLIRRHGVSHMQIVPSLLRLLVAHVDIGQCISLTDVFSGGEVLPKTLMEAAIDRLPGRLHNTYGPTEATIDATFWTCRRGETGQSVPIGRPIRNTQCYVLDDAMTVVPIGVAGELFVGGAGVALGYLNRPELTAAAFVADPFADEPAARLYRTGDRVRWRPDGLLEFLGRTDDQVKLRGLRIELGEIEQALAGHPAVAQAVVVVREDTPGAERLVGYYVPVGPERPGRADFRDAMHAMLPDYMIPAVFVALEALPLNRNGKIDRKALPAPADIAVDAERALVAPRSQAEEALEPIWAEVLGLEAVSVEDDFFELGGHSLLATQLASRIATGFDIDLSLRSLFEAPTIAELAVIVEQLILDDIED